MAVETSHYNVTSVVTQLVATEPELYSKEEIWLAIIPLYHMYGALTYVFLSRELLSLAPIYIIATYQTVSELVAQL
jgi:long-subunit acyl-CoA synthetase (AMP-forming)